MPPTNIHLFFFFWHDRPERLIKTELGGNIQSACWWSFSVGDFFPLSPCWFSTGSIGSDNFTLLDLKVKKKIFFHMVYGSIHDIHTWLIDKSILILLIETIVQPKLAYFDSWFNWLTVKSMHKKYENSNFLILSQ